MKPFLRQLRPQDTALQQAYAEDQQALATLNPQDPAGTAPERLRLLGQLGDTARTLNQPQASLDYLQEALKLADSRHDARSALANRIRLGTTLQYLDRFEEAGDHFEQALRASLEPELADYRDFALQHTGKLLAEQGHYEHARHCFEQALQLRQRKGDAELIASSEDALELLETVDGLYHTEDGFAETQFTAEFDLSGLPDSAEV